MKYTVWAIISLYFAAGSPVGQKSVKSLPAQTSRAILMTDQESSFRTYIELLRSDVTKNRVQIVGQVMQLDPQNAVKFWPIYAEFEAEYKKFGYGALALILNYATDYNEVAPQVADQLAHKLLDIEQEFKVALDPITAAKFIQVENQIERILDLQISSQLPAIDVPESSPL
jgi:hypothetical protein